MITQESPADALQAAIEAECELRYKRKQIVDELNRLKAQLVFMDDKLRTAHCHVVELEAVCRQVA